MTIFGNNSFWFVLNPASESCTTDQSCLIEEEGDEQTSQFDGSDPGDIILKLLHLAGHSSPHRVHQWAALDIKVSLQALEL